MITVLTNGCFDCFHYGHLVYLQKARALGDRLVVGLTMDAYVNKGPGRPVFPFAQRMGIVAALRCVDGVWAVSSGLQAIELVRPDIYVKGKDWADKNIPEEAIMEKMGGKVVYLDTMLYSSTEILEGKLLERIRAARESR
jgi:rfaE bifunctional protein nucleotidyltransferase chain/domain